MSVSIRNSIHEPVCPFLAGSTVGPSDDSKTRTPLCSPDKGHQYTCMNKYINFIKFGSGPVTFTSIMKNYPRAKKHICISVYGLRQALSSSSTSQIQQIKCNGLLLCREACLLCILQNKKTCNTHYTDKFLKQHTKLNFSGSA